MTLRIQFTTLALGASIDQQTGALSIFEILDEVRAAQLPIQMGQMVLAISLEKLVRHAVRGKIFIHLITPDEKQVMIGNGDLEVPENQRRLKAVFRLAGFPFSQTGRHRFVISWVNSEGQKESEGIIDLEVLTQPAEIPGPNTSSGTHH
jgi:hypothetical protein